MSYMIVLLPREHSLEHNQLKEKRITHHNSQDQTRNVASRILEESKLHVMFGVI